MGAIELEVKDEGGSTRAAQPPGGGPVAGRKQVPIPVRVLGMASLLVLCTVVVRFQEEYRMAEARLGAILMRVLLDSHAINPRGSTLIIFDGGRPSVFGVKLVPGCSTSLLLAPMLLVAALLVGAGRVGFFRAVAAVVVASTTVWIGNMARFLTMVLSIRRWGPETGFGYSHTFIGSACILSALVVAAYLFYRIVRDRSDDEPPAIPVP